MPTTDEDALVALAHAWDAAMVRNDAREIGRFMADDWVIVGSDGRSTSKEAFLGQIESGELVHDTMESRDIEVRLYGDAALLRARGVSGGLFRGRTFLEYEQQSNVFVRRGTTWRCVFTQVSRLANDDAMA